METARICECDYPGSGPWMRPGGFLALSLAGGLGDVFLQGPNCAEGCVPTAGLLAQGLRLFHKARLPFHREGDTAKPDLSPCPQMTKVSKGSTCVCRRVHACEHVWMCAKVCIFSCVCICEHIFEYLVHVCMWRCVCMCVHVRARVWGVSWVPE